MKKGRLLFDDDGVYMRNLYDIVIKESDFLDSLFCFEWTMFKANVSKLETAIEKAYDLLRAASLSGNTTLISDFSQILVSLC